MSMDFTSSNEPTREPESEGSMFAAHPIWERNAKKKRGFGRSRSTAAPAAMAAGSATVDPMVAPATEAEPMMVAQPYTRTTTTRKKDGVPAVAIAAGVIALGGLAAAGWYASQPRNTGVAQLTPGAAGENALAPSMAPMTTTTTTAAAPTAAHVIPASAPPAVTRRTTTTTRVAAATPRVRPAASSSSATNLGVNTSATLPAGPQPYSGAASVTAPPAPLPSTPAVEPDPAPSASSPTTTPATPAPQTTTAPPATTTPQ